MSFQGPIWVPYMGTKSLRYFGNRYITSICKVLQSMLINHIPNLHARTC